MGFIAKVIILVIMGVLLFQFPFVRDFGTNLKASLQEKQANIISEYDRIKGKVDDTVDKVNATKEKVEDTVDAVSDAVNKVNGLLGGDDDEDEAAEEDGETEEEGETGE